MSASSSAFRIGVPNRRPFIASGSDLSLSAATGISTRWVHDEQGWSFLGGGPCQVAGRGAGAGRLGVLRPEPVLRLAGSGRRIRGARWFTTRYYYDAVRRDMGSA